MILILFLLFAPLSQAYLTFQAFKTAFNKVYNSTEQADRQTYYNSAVTDAQALVSSGVSYTIAQNQFWDQSPEEFSKLSKSVKVFSGPLKDDYAAFKTGGNEQSLVADITQINWETKGAVTSIRNQGDCGSAWAFAVVAMCQSAIILKEDQTNDLSEQRLLACTSESSCSGGFVQYAMQTAVNKGFPQQSAFPYTPESTTSEVCSSTENIVYPGQSYFQFYDLVDEQILGLLKFGPVITHVSATNWIYYSAGIFECPQNSEISHAALIVGVDSTSWILKNSWGDSWGENGYIRVSRNTASNCGIGSAIFVLSEKLFKMSLAITLLALLFLI